MHAEPPTMRVSRGGDGGLWHDDGEQVNDKNGQQHDAVEDDRAPGSQHQHATNSESRSSTEDLASIPGAGGNSYRATRN